MNALRGTFTTNQKLGLAAVLLGVGALFGTPAPGPVARVDTRDMAAMVEGEVDHVTADELAGWIIEGRADYRLVDLRDEEAYGAYHIPTAERIEITGLLGGGLERNEKIVLYSNGGIHSAQAWFLLQAQGYRASYMLLGGLQEWKDGVLFPVLPDGASTQEQAQFERREHVSTFFGGKPQTGGATAPPPDAVMMPEVKAPTAIPAARRKRKAREGC